MTRSCETCAWSDTVRDKNGVVQLDTEGRPRLRCHFEVRLVTTKSQQAMEPKVDLRTGRTGMVPLMVHTLVSTFPSVEPDWWCSHFSASPH